MERYAIRQSTIDSTQRCELCGTEIVDTATMQICRADVDRPICRSCGRQHAPAMVALLDLAGVAEKVVKKGRHLLTPPMESLLDLARAAEAYSDRQLGTVQK